MGGPMHLSEWQIKEIVTRFNLSKSDEDALRRISAESGRHSFGVNFADIRLRDERDLAIVRRIVNNIPMEDRVRLLGKLPRS
jgi:hypothetical protein